jgi:MYXO-CTERM domain-containing protein
MRNYTPVQKAAALVGAVFLLIGILGFIPGITINYDQLGLWENKSDAELFGLFQVSVLHNFVHLLFGVVGLALARTWKTARTYLIGGGLFYLALALFGALIDQNRDANFVPTNNADDWLHLALGLGMLALGVLTARRRSEDEVFARGDTQRSRSGARVGARVR